MSRPSREASPQSDDSARPSREASLQSDDNARPSREASSQSDDSGDESDSAAAMSSASRKHQNFVTGPMGDKLVTELAGIGDVLGQRLTEATYDKAYVVVGKFLLLKKEEELFKQWLKDTSGANAKQQNYCYQCIKEWCDSFM